MNKLYFLIPLLCLLFTFGACSNDDDDKKDIRALKELLNSKEWTARDTMGFDIVLNEALFPKFSMFGTIDWKVKFDNDSYMISRIDSLYEGGELRETGLFFDEGICLFNDLPFADFELDGDSIHQYGKINSNNNFVLFYRLNGSELLFK